MTQRHKFIFLFDFLKMMPGKNFLQNNPSFQNEPVLTKKDILNMFINFAL